MRLPVVLLVLLVTQIGLYADLRWARPIPGSAMREIRSPSIADYSVNVKPEPLMFAGDTLLSATGAHVVAVDLNTDRVMHLTHSNAAKGLWITSDERLVLDNVGCHESGSSAGDSALPRLETVEGTAALCQAVRVADFSRAETRYSQFFRGGDRLFRTLFAAPAPGPEFERLERLDANGAVVREWIVHGRGVPVSFDGTSLIAVANARKALSDDPDAWLSPERRATLIRAGHVLDADLLDVHFKMEFKGPLSTEEDCVRLFFDRVEGPEATCTRALLSGSWCISPDGTTLATTELDGAVRVYAAPSTTARVVPDIAGDDVLRMAVGGNTLLIGTRTSDLLLYDLDTMRLLGRHHKDPQWLAVSVDGRRAAFTWGCNEVTVIDVDAVRGSVR